MFIPPVSSDISKIGHVLCRCRLGGMEADPETETSGQKPGTGGQRAKCLYA
ncbi:hypothetical protein CEB3_c24900 [Peptococcaceae bacterium CEB3]|nr:hypothetical protein CEB3_c24900 [Peptococcaceae bacterium CEB3]